MAAPAPPSVLLSADRIAARVAELATQISRDYAGVDDLLLVGVLRGVFIFLADLSRRLTVPCSVDLVALSRYEHGSTPSGEVRLIMDLRVPITGRHVLLVEDIVDSGGTLGYLTRTLRARNPASLRICTLTRKPDRAPPELRIDYVGFPTSGWSATGWTTATSSAHFPTSVCSRGRPPAPMTVTPVAARWRRRGGSGGTSRPPLRRHARARRAPGTDAWPAARRSIL